MITIIWCVSFDEQIVSDEFKNIPVASDQLKFHKIYIRRLT